MNVPLEQDEQRDVVQYCEIVGHKLTAIPNSTYTKSIKQKVKNRRDGLRAGLPDLFIIVDNMALFIEMKRVKGSRLSEEQKGWIDAINETQVPAFVAYGAEEAIRIIQSFEKKPRATIF